MKGSRAIRLDKIAFRLIAFRNLIWVSCYWYRLSCGARCCAVGSRDEEAGAGARGSTAVAVEQAAAAAVVAAARPAPLAVIVLSFPSLYSLILCDYLILYWLFLCLDFFTRSQNYSLNLKHDFSDL